MKKLFFVFLILMVFGSSIFAFDITRYPPPINAGDFIIDAGLGFIRTGYNLGSYSVPPLFVQAEFALPPVPVSLGAGLLYFGWKYAYPLEELAVPTGFNMHIVTPQFRVNWHWGFDVVWLDLYTGVGFGWDIVRTKWENAPDGWSADPPGSSGVFWNFQVGAHFFFSQGVGAVLEAGYPYLMKAGISFRF